MTARRFLVLLRGLSADSLYRHAVSREPVELSGESARQSMSRW